MATTDYEAVPAVERDDSTPRLGTVVMKFGGTSVADAEKLKNVARRLVAAREGGSRVVAVLSAMGRTTDELLDLARQISDRPVPRELDMLISVGERISCALAAMALHDLGHEAISLTGSQAGIVTDTVHGKAKIVEVRAKRIHDALDEGRIVLVAGFQGISSESFDVTTLGRGGSDTTAVALAAALDADSCEIYTDVEGDFTADPRIVPGARKLEGLFFEEMLEMASSGARVIATRSNEVARSHNAQLHVRSTERAWRVTPASPRRPSPRSSKRGSRRRSSPRRRSRSRVTSPAQTSIAPCRRSTRRSSLASPRIGVIGATGAVGGVLRKLLRGQEHVRYFASDRSAGKPLDGKTVEEATPDALAAGELDVCFFAVGAKASRELVP